MTSNFKINKAYFVCNNWEELKAFRIKEHNRDINRIKKEINKLNTKIIWHTKNDWLDELNIEFMQGLIETYTRQLKKLIWKKHSYINNNNNTKGRNFNLDIIKEVPISNFIGIESTMSSADKDFYLSPFREETKPSLAVYKKTNSWYDFGTNEGGDNIDLFMKLNSVDFKNACEMLQNI